MVGWSVSQDKSGQAFGEVDGRRCINTSEDQKRRNSVRSDSDHEIQLGTLRYMFLLNCVLHTPLILYSSSMNRVLLEETTTLLFFHTSSELIR